MWDNHGHGESQVECRHHQWSPRQREVHRLRPHPEDLHAGLPHEEGGEEHWASPQLLRGAEPSCNHSPETFEMVQAEPVAEFDERLWGAMVDYVTVGADGGMTVVFWDGTGI